MVLYQGTTSKPALSAVEGCRKRRINGGALAPEGSFLSRRRGFMQQALVRVVAVNFLVVGVMLRFVVLRGVIAQVRVFGGSLVVLAARERGACKHRQKESDHQELAHARILTRTRSLSAKPW